MNARAAIYAGIAAGIGSTLAQVLLWVLFTDAFPAILVRDTRYAAAIVLGPRALAEGSSMAAIWVAATLVHFALSIVYAFLLGAAIRHLRLVASLIAGALFGAALYAINMYVFTVMFPWFANARDPITLAAHLVFGIVAAFVYMRAAARPRKAGDDE